MKRIVLTERDKQIIDFLSEYKCATTTTISNIFFNGSKRPTTRRLKLLREHGLINSAQEFVCLEQIHYINKKPKQIKHTIIETNFISKLYENNIEILKLKKEFKIGNVRSDLLLVCKIDNKALIYFIEVCNTKPFDTNKYIRLKDSNYWKEYFPVFPSIIVISDKPITDSKYLNIISLNLSLNNFNKIKE